MNWLKKIDNNFEEYLSFLLFSIMVILIFLQVIFRFIFNFSLAWTEEMSRYTFVALVYFSAVIAVKRGRHLRTEGIIQALPNKIKKWVYTFSDIIWLSFTIIMVKLGYDSSLSVLLSGQKSPVLHVKVGLIYMLIPICFALLSLRIIQQIIKRIKNDNIEISSVVEKN